MVPSFGLHVFLLSKTRFCQMPNVKTILLLCLCCTVLLVSSNVLVSTAAEQPILPPAPSGYSWRRMKSIRAGFLVPQGWFVKEEQKGDTHAIFITKESIERGGLFRTGFSLNAIRNSPNKTGSPPSQYAKRFVDKIASSATQASEVRPVRNPHFGGYGVFSRSKRSGETTVAQYTLALGNDKTGTLYICTFESPEHEWVGAWKVGFMIVDNLALETEF